MEIEFIRMYFFVIFGDYEGVNVGMRRDAITIYLRIYFCFLIMCVYRAGVFFLSVDFVFTHNTI